MQIVRKTALFFQPQIRTKIFNEGWASFWHEILFLQDIADGKVKGHEVDFARVDAKVTSIPRVGINPYGLGRLLLQYIKEMARKGKFSLEYQLLKNQKQRKDYDRELGEKVGIDKLFELRRTLSDFQLINFLTDEDFQDFVTKNRLFVAGARINLDRRTKEYYVKSRKGGDYRRMINRTLYHPPHIRIKKGKTRLGALYLDHVFEDRTLITDWIPKVMRDIEFLWRGPKHRYGGPIKLDTTEFEVKPEDVGAMQLGANVPSQYNKIRYRYTLDRGVKSKSLIEKEEIENE